MPAARLLAVSEADEKQALHRYLQNAREVLLWKLQGLSDYDIRRPMTPTGTNLLGLVKHCAGVECGYFGQVVDRPFPPENDLDWNDDEGELSGDMYATAAESREQVTGFYRRVWAHSDATIEQLPLDARGTVPWWPEERRHPTLHTLLVHTIQETARHAGHADIIREFIDGAAGLREGVSNMPPEADAAAWRQHYDKLESIAREAQPSDP
ncbi:MAG: DinB family protein [Actinobacteria bacterium]|nr:DinB family protein [Actinomycetota bacterium]